MKWEDYKKEKEFVFSKITGLEQVVATNIECPQCGGIVYKDVGLVLASYPPKYNYKCLKCGWSSTYY